MAQIVKYVFCVSSLVSISLYFFGLCVCVHYLSTDLSLICWLPVSSWIRWLSFSVCCASLLDGYWFMVLQFCSGSMLRKMSLYPGLSYNILPIDDCTKLTSVCNQKSCTLFRVKSGRQSARKTSLVISGTSS